jgi:hypothetical protein
MLIDGWIGDPVEQRAWRNAEIFIDGKTFAAATCVRRRRSDIARSPASTALESAGFTLVIELNSLEVGRHELVLCIEGKYALPTVDFEITPGRSNAAVVDSSRFHFDRDATFRFQFGMPGFIRGTVTSRSPGVVATELYALFDECDAYPAQLDVAEAGYVRTPGVTPFLACFVTQKMALGTHTLRFAVRAGDDSLLHVSERSTIEITPLSISGLHPRLADSLALASIDWADQPASAEIASPLPRAVSRGTIVGVRGWAVDIAARDSAKRAFVRFANGATFEMEMRGLREDVARSLDMPAARYCGMHGSIATRALEPGRNVGSCYIIAKRDSIAYRSGTGIEIDVSD